jgi:hypothetical protein
MFGRPASQTLSIVTRVVALALLLGVYPNICLGDGAGDLVTVSPVSFDLEPGRNLALVSIPLRDCDVSEEISSVVISPVFTGIHDEHTGAVEIEAIVSSEPEFEDVQLPVSADLVESRSGFKDDFNRVSLDITSKVIAQAQCGTTLYVLLGSISENPVGLSSPCLFGEGGEWYLQVTYKR